MKFGFFGQWLFCGFNERKKEVNNVKRKIKK